MSFPIPEPFQWDASFDIKNDELNEQHKKLFTGIADLAAAKDDASKLSSLLELVQLHFATEEKLFKEKNYDKFESHKATHDKFVSDAVAATKDGVNDDIIKFLKNWLVTHIKATDMEYVGKI